jgi:cytoskeletal protein RodZ
MIGRRGQPSAQEEDKPKGFDDFDLRLGDLMRGERATLGKSLLDVQRDLKIKATYVAAIENCDVAAFETPGFIAGYVRSYARYLGMEPEWAFSRFCDESGFVPAHGMALSAARQKRAAAKSARRGVYSDPLANPDAAFVPKGPGFLSEIQPGAIGSLTVLVALIGGLGYGGWTVMQEVQRVRLAPVDQAPGVAADLDPLAAATRMTGMVEPRDASLENSVSAAGSDPVIRAAEGFDRLYRPQALDAPVLVARDGPISAIDPTPPQQEAADTRLALSDPATPDNAPAVQVSEPLSPTVEIFAIRPAWVRITAADGTILLEKTLDAGERFEVPQTEAPARLRAGNSGSVFFAVNGETYGPAASGAQVVSNLALSVDALTESLALADLESDPELARILSVAEAASE